MAIPGTTKAGIWAFIFIFWACGTVWLWYGPSANSFPRQFDLTTPGVGTLSTKRWSFDFWISAMYVMVWTLPITLAFAMDGPTAKWRLTTHNVFVVLFSLWLLATFIHGCIFWGNANSSEPEYFGNLAHDDRWCCVYYTKSGAPCAQSGACNPGVGASDLKTSGPFLWNLWWSFVFFVFFVLDFILSMCVLRPAFEKEIIIEQIEDAKRMKKLLPDYEEDEAEIRSKLVSARRPKYKAKGK